VIPFTAPLGKNKKKRSLNDDSSACCKVPEYEALANKGKDDQAIAHFEKALPISHVKFGLSYPYTQTE
jgi:hypothetical protein